MHREPQLTNAALMARRQLAVARGVGQAHEIFIARGSNAELWDVEGRRFIDFAGGIAVLNTGLCHPEVIAAVKEFRQVHPMPGVQIRLAAGNAGVLAAINEEVERSELPMMLYVYAAIVLLVFGVLFTLDSLLPLRSHAPNPSWFEVAIGVALAVVGWILRRVARSRLQRAAQRGSI